MSSNLFSAFLENSKLGKIVDLAVMLLMPAVTVFVWVSLPLFLLQRQINLAFLGVIYSVGILGALLIRIPMRYYMERGRNDVLPMMALLIAGISLSLFYVSFNMPMVILSFLIISISGAMYRGVRSRKQERNIRNTEPMRNMFSQDMYATSGIAALLILSALYPNHNVVQLYGIVSVIILMIGFLSLAYSISTKTASPELIQKSSLKDHARNAIAPLKSFDRVVNRKIVFPYLAIQSLIYLSICIVSIFLPAMAVKDNIDFSDIFLAFAAFSVIAYLLDRVAQKISFLPAKEVFYMFRPVFLIIPFLILSMAISQVLFVAGYFIILLWILSDSASSDMMLKSMGEGDQIRSRILIQFISVPISIVGPLIGSIMWLASPRLLYGVAIIPAAISMLMVMLMLERTPRIASTNTT